MQTNRASLYFPLLCTIGVAVLICVLIFNQAHEVRIEDQAYVQGTLLESSQIDVAKHGKTVRFTLAAHSVDFRIDPYLFRDVMKGAMPTSFLPGATVRVQVSRKELASPTQPLLKPSLRLIWVNGLSINGRKEFGVENTVNHETNDRYVGYGLLAAFVAMCGYVWLDWFRKSHRMRN